MLSTIERVSRFRCYGSLRRREEENCERNNTQLFNSTERHRDLELYIASNYFRNLGTCISPDRNNTGNSSINLWKCTRREMAPASSVIVSQTARHSTVVPERVADAGLRSAAFPITSFSTAGQKRYDQASTMRMRRRPVLRVCNEVLEVTVRLFVKIICVLFGYGTANMLHGSASGPAGSLIFFISAVGAFATLRLIAYRLYPELKRSDLRRIREARIPKRSLR